MSRDTMEGKTMVAVQVLVAEGDGVVAEDIARALKKLEYGVPAVVSSGEAAITEAAGGDVDLALIDVLLDGDMDGIDAAREINARFDIPVVYLTARADEAILERAGATQPFGYILKPFSERKLHCAVQMALQKHWMQAALRKREERFRSLIENASDLIAILDERRTIRYASPSARRVLGYAPQSLLGRDAFALLHPDDSERIAGVFDEILRTKATQAAECRCRHKDGSWRFLEAVGTNLLDVPSVAGIVVNARDVTPRLEAEAALQEAHDTLERRVEERTAEFRTANEALRRVLADRRQAEEALRESEARFRALVESTSDWLWAVDQNFVYTYASPKVKDLLGYDPREVIGKTPYDFMSLEEACRVAVLIAPLVESRAPLERLENSAIHKDGSRVVLETSGVPTFDESGAFLGYRGVDRDITEYKLIDRLRIDREHRYHRLLSAITSYAYSVHFDGGFHVSTEHGEGCQAVTGYLPEDYAANPHLWISMVHPGDRRTLLKHLSSVHGGEEVHPIEHRLIHKDRTVRWVRNTIVRHCDDDGNLVRYDGVVEDITDRKSAEETLRDREEQLSAAQKIQQQLLPHAAPVVPGLDIAGDVCPADFAAGDYFDYLLMPDGSVGFAVGDVAGHGFGPALLMASTHTLMRGLVEGHADVAEILTLANAALAKDIEEHRFVTVLLARIDPRSRSLVYANAGHPTGFVLDPWGSVKTPLPSTGLPLGILPDTQFAASGPIVLETGDTVVLMTDGILEARSPTGELFGDERVLNVLRAHRHATAADVVKKLVSAAGEFSQRRTPVDDMTAIVIKVTSLPSDST